MVTFRRSALFVFVFVLLFLTPKAFPRTVQQLRSHAGTRVDVISTQKYAPGEVLVRFREKATPGARNSLHQALKANVAKRFESVPSLELVRLPEGTGVLDAVRSYRADPNVLYAEPNFVVHALGASNDPAFPQQWHLSNTAQLGGGVAGADIHAAEAWQLTTGSKPVAVVTLDSGVDYTHSDLNTNLFNNAADCNSNGVDDDGDGYADDCYGINTVAHTSDPMDDNGHGTHVAGLIGAIGNNGIGVSGVNWNIRIVACKFLDNWGNGTVAGAVECLNYARTLKSRGVNVVATNNSWGGVEFSQALADAIEAQLQAGILFVASAGNDYSDNDLNPVYPANFASPNIISVAATTNSDRLALFSNVGTHTVLIGAPGQEVFSTLPADDYGYMSGTSMAAPLVTGVAALVAAKDPSVTWKEIKNRILAGGDPLRELQKTITGRRLNAYGALTCNNSDLLKRLRPAQRSIAGAIGSPLLISYLNINCGQPGNALEAKVSTGEAVSLKDDGIGADPAANDGVFTGSWTPAQTGSYTISLPDGDSVSVQVLTAYRAVQELATYREITGKSLNLSDDSVASFTSPFPIRYGEGSFSDVFVSSDGTISFTNPFQSFYNRMLPLLWDNYVGRIWDSSAVTLAAPFWDDLYPVPDSDQNVFWEVTGAAPNRELVIEWRNVRFFDCRNDADKTISFEVVLRENDSNVLFLYNNVESGCALSYNRHDFGQSATVGVQVAPDRGSSWFYDDGVSRAGIVANGMALRWQLETVPVPDNPVPTLSQISPNQANADSPDTTITITGTGFVPGSFAIWDPPEATFSPRLRTTYVSSTQLTATIPAMQLSAPFRGKHQIGVFNPQPGGGGSNALPFGVGMPPAWITSLSPASVVAGGPACTITINGTGFGDASTGSWVDAFWNDQRRTTRRISATQIQMDVTATDIAKPGTAKIYVYVNGWGTTNTVDFPITASTGKSSSIMRYEDGVAVPGTPPRPYRFLGWGQAANAGDDYMKRLSRPYAGSNLASSAPSVQTATANSQTATPSLPFGTPLPGIALRPTLPTGFLPTSVAIADFNRDGKSDWAITNGGDNSVWIYPGHGDGTWDPPRIIRLRGLSPVAIIAVDLRGTGVCDLLVAEIDSATLGLLRGRGDGTFEDEDEYFLPAPPAYLSSGDFNNDGRRDILVGTLGTVAQGALFLMKGDGGGRLGSPVWLPNHKRYPLTAPSAAWLALGDWNKDGFLDATASEPWGDVTSESGLLAYLNRGDGSFKEGQEVYDNFVEPNYGVDSGDINEDGCQDLVVVLGVEAALPYLGHCDGTFTWGEAHWIGLGEFSYGIRLADVNGDGHLDLVASGIFSGGGGAGYGNDSGILLSVAFGKGDGWFDRPRVYRGESSAFMFDIGDVNGDGKPDIITANQDSDSATLFVNQGNGEFGPPAGAYVGYAADGDGGAANSPLSEPVVVDITGDGRPDIGYLEVERYYGTPYNVAVLPNLGAGKFGPPVRSPIGTGDYYFYDFLFGDFRKTGRSDLIALRSGINGDYISYLFAPANSDGTFGAPSVVQTNTGWGALGSGDFNRDGKLDFLIADVTSAGLRLSVFLGDNTGKFTPLTPTVLSGSFGTRPYSVHVADMNKDGNFDALIWLAYNVAPYTDHDVYEFLGKGDGTFATGQRVLQNMERFRLADVNHDGLPDVVEFSVQTATPSEDVIPNIRVFLGKPDGAFALKYTYSPYAGTPAYVEQGRIVVIPPASSRLADFDGDGELDVAVFQTPSYVGHSAYMQFMKGKGDGSFTPTYAVHRLETRYVPYIAADFDGDGIADLFDLVAYSSSWHIIPGKPGPQFQLALTSQPIVGQQGTLRITMNAPADQPVTLALKSSDLAVTIPASTTVPAAAISSDVPFQITNAFDDHRTFSITATSATQSQTVYASQFPHGVAGFALAMMGPTSFSILPAQTITYSINVVSTKGWQGAINQRCEGLPEGAACVLPGSVTLEPGKAAAANLQVATTAAIAQGAYRFSFVASDGVNEQRMSLQLKVGDFDVQVSPDTASVVSSGWTAFNLNLPSTYDYSGLVNLSCDGLPSTVSCSGSFATAGDPAQIGIYASNATPGDYSFRIVGTSNGVTRSGQATLRVMDLTTSYDPKSGSLKVGESLTSTLTVAAPNGFDEEVALTCYSPANVSCSLSSTTLRFSSGPDSKTVQVTMKANRLSASTVPAPSQRAPGGAGRIYLAFLPFVVAGAAFSRKKYRKSLGAMVLVVALSAFTLSCGGGGGSTNPPTPPPPPPPPTPTTTKASVTLYLKSNSIYQRYIGAIELTISQ